MSTTVEPEAKPVVSKPSLVVIRSSALGDIVENPKQARRNATKVVTAAGSDHPSAADISTSGRVPDQERDQR